MKSASVLYLGDNNYCKYACTSIESLLDNNKHLDEIVVYYINENLNSDNLNKLNSIIDKYNRELVLIDAEVFINFLKENSVPAYRGTYNLYFKWIVFDYIKPNTERLIYIDSDTIVVDKIDRMIDYDISDCSLAMSKDCMYRFYCKQLKLKKIEYFNAGVVIFNVKKYKENNMQEKYMKFLVKNEKQFMFSEQDVANVVYNGEIKVLPLQFNLIVHSHKLKYLYFARDLSPDYYYTKEEIGYAKDNPIICHCSDYFGMRPWIKGSDHPYQKLFDKYFYSIGYTEKDKIEPKNNISFKIQRVIKSLPEPLKALAWRVSKQIQISIKK